MRRCRSGRPRSIGTSDAGSTRSGSPSACRATGRRPPSQMKPPHEPQSSLDETEGESMSEIIPRWEVRTFGRQFGAAEVAFAELEPRDVQDSDELYLLTREGDETANVVKIRFDLMDVKALREVSSDGLERWEPVMKVAFPMTTADMERVREALDLPAPAVARDDYTRHQFIDEVATRSG